MFYKKYALENVAKSAGQRPATFLKQILRQRYFPVNLAKFSRTSFCRTSTGDCFLIRLWERAVNKQLLSLRKTCPYLVLFWSVFSRIQSEYGKIRTRITLNTDTFYVVYLNTFIRLRICNILQQICSFDSKFGPFLDQRKTNCMTNNCYHICFISYSLILIVLWFKEEFFNSITTILCSLKTTKAKGFLVFLQGTKWEHWPEID